MSGIAPSAQLPLGVMSAESRGTRQPSWIKLEQTVIGGQSSDRRACWSRAGWYTDDRRERADACVVVPIMNEGSVPEDLLRRMEMSAKSRTRLP